MATFNSYDTLEENKFLDWSKLKEATDHKLNIGQKWNFDHTVNNLENEGKAGHQDFLLFPHCF